MRNIASICQLIQLTLNLPYQELVDMKLQINEN